MLATMSIGLIIGTMLVVALIGFVAWWLGGWASRKNAFFGTIIYIFAGVCCLIILLKAFGIELQIPK